MGKQYWTVAEAAKFYGVTERAVRERCIKGQLKAEKIFSDGGAAEWKIERKSSKTNPQPHKNIPNDDWTVDEAAKYLGLTPQTIRRRLRSGELHGYEIGSEEHREWRIKPEIVKEHTANKLIAQEEAKARRQLVRDEAKQHLLIKSMEEMSHRVFSGRITPITPPRSKKKLSRILNIAYSDLHFGSDLQANKCMYNYGVLEEARRLAFTVQQVCQYKREHRDETILNVLMNGDIIENQLHDPRVAADLSEQILRSTHLLSQAVAHFSAEFKQVNIYCATGNHGRRKDRHKERAAEDKYDSYETVIYGVLSQMAKNLPNVTFHIPLLPFTEFDLFGKKALITHGDNVITVGNVGTSLNIGRIENQINKINSSLVDLDEYSVIVLGHIHKGMHIPLDNGSTLITNPALIPPNSYALSLGVFEARTGQAMWESTEEYPVGDFRFIWVDRNTDAQSDLDEIIQPWPGNFAA